MSNIPYETYIELLVQSDKLTILQSTLGPLAWTAAIILTVSLGCCVYFGYRWWKADAEMERWREVAENLRVDYIRLENKKTLVAQQNRIIPRSRVRSKVK